MHVAWAPSAVVLNGLSCPSFPPEWGSAGGWGGKLGPGSFWVFLRFFFF